VARRSRRNAVDREGPHGFASGTCREVHAGNRIRPVRHDGRRGGNADPTESDPDAMEVIVADGIHEIIAAIVEDVRNGW